MKVGTDTVLLGAAVELSEASGRKSDRPHKILDVGTGTGAVALMLAQRLGYADYKIDAIDIDEASSSEAAGNFARSPWADHLTATHCPLREWKGTGYDLIVSNPPFFDESLKNPDQRRSAARHTDTLSYRDILVYATENMTAEGRVTMILPADVEKALIRTAGGFGLFPCSLVRIRTTARKPVKRIIATFSRLRNEFEVAEILMMENGEYTTAYRRLVGPFLLNL